MRRGSLIVASLLIMVIVFTILFSLQRLIDMRISGFAPLQRESIVDNAPTSR